MDGNGRWAKQRLLPRLAGHKAGIDAVRRTVEAAVERGIEVLSLFTFSSENWRRPPDEVENILSLFLQALQSDSHQLHQNNVRLRIIGNTQAFSEKLQKSIAEAEALTASNKGLTLVIAANYGGQWDFINAAQKIAALVASGDIQPDAIDETCIAQHLTLSDLPYPDLLIRTGGEQRISNFFLWQLAYAELYFPAVYWPDFNAEELDKALAFYASRERRFGLTSEQIK